MLIYPCGDSLGGSDDDKVIFILSERGERDGKEEVRAKILKAVRTFLCFLSIS